MKTQLCNKIQSLEDEVHELTKEKKEQQQYTEQLKSQLTTVQELTHNTLVGNLHIPRSQKHGQDYNKKYQKAKDKKLAKEIKVMLTACDTKTFEPSEVQLTNKDTNERVVLDLATGQYNPVTENKPSQMEVLYVKEKFAISDRAYHEMSSLCSHLPPQHHLKKLSKSLDSESDITSPPNGIVGVQQSLRDRLQIRHHHMIEQMGIVHKKYELSYQVMV